MAKKASVTPPEVLEAAWRPEPPTGDAWTPRPWVAPSVRIEEGRRKRKAVKRTSHAELRLRPDRDPIAILDAQEEDRLAHLVPLRHQRMADNAFAYYRGTPAVMAYDLADTPRTDIIVQASGDAHLANFGLFASPERKLVFDANDFDETLPAPWEWDIKRLATSMIIGSRANGYTPSQARATALGAVRSYRESMATFASMRLLDVWYLHIGEAEIREAAMAHFASDPRILKRRARLEGMFQEARSKDSMKAAAKLTKLVDGKRVFVDEPPVVQHIEIPGGMEGLRAVFEAYRASMADNRREFLERYRFGDAALKVVGVGSVGTRCFVVVLLGRDEDDPLFLQVKEATASVLEPAAGPSEFPHHGQRVVVGQRLMQATPDIFLGWSTGPGRRHFYFRQLWDMKGSVDTSVLRPDGMAFYGALCARVLARAHARSGDAVAISAYLGEEDTFDGAIADYAEAYADLNERDFAAYQAAIAEGRVSLP